MSEKCGCRTIEIVSFKNLITTILWRLGSAWGWPVCENYGLVIRLKLWFNHSPSFSKGSKSVRWFQEVLFCLVILRGNDQPNSKHLVTIYYILGKNDLPYCFCSLRADHLVWENRTYGWETKNIRKNINSKITYN